MRKRILGTIIAAGFFAVAAFALVSDTILKDCPAIEIVFPTDKSTFNDRFCCTHMFLLDHGYSLQILIAVPSASYMYEYFFLYIQWYKYVLNATEYTNCCILIFIL